MIIEHATRTCHEAWEEQYQQFQKIGVQCWRDKICSCRAPWKSSSQLSPAPLAKFFSSVSKENQITARLKAKKKKTAPAFFDKTNMKIRSISTSPIVFN